MNFDKYDAYEALSVGKKDGVFVRELPGGEMGQVGLATTQAALRVSWDGSGFYNGGCYHSLGLADLANVRGLVRHVGAFLERCNSDRYVVAARDSGTLRRNLLLNPVVQPGRLGVGDTECKAPQRRWAKEKVARRGAAQPPSRW